MHFLFVLIALAAFQGKPASSPASQPAPRVVRMKVTAYCLCQKCCGKWAADKVRKTSTGDDATIYDGVAADPKLLPYRTRLNIPGVGVKEVDDTGGAMRQSAKKNVTHIDVRMPSHQEALKFGVRWLDVTMLPSSHSAQGERR
mgnify:FL=1